MKVFNDDNGTQQSRKTEYRQSLKIKIPEPNLNSVKINPQPDLPYNLPLVQPRYRFHISRAIIY
jgi:hypothetical protein